MLLNRLLPTLLLTLLTLLCSSAGQADDATTASEIEQLLLRVAHSGCIFTRNGRDHDSADAADHLRLKSRRGKSYYSTSEQFIDRLATESSWTGKPYSVQCPGVAPQSSNQWLHALLDDLRKSAP